MRSVCVFLAALIVSAGIALGSPEQSQAASTPLYGQYCRSGAPIRSVSTSDKVISFTFDDGPWPKNTEAVMTTFERYGWRANFFMIGSNVRQYPSIARSVVQRGHGVAAHTVTHSYGVSTIAREVATSANIIESATGIRPTFFRSPGLTQSSTIDRAVYNAGMCNISTGYDLGDWRSPRASSYTLCSRFKNALKPGAIILLHDGGSHSQTVNAVSCMLDTVRRNGYRVVDLGALLSRNYSPAPAPVPTPPEEGCYTSSLGQQGTAVVNAQRAMMNSGIYLRGGADGDFGPYTAAAVREYQSKRGLDVTGAVNIETAAAMGLCATDSPSTPTTPGWSTVSIGERGSTVASIQRAIISNGIFLLGGADGIYGSYTQAAVQSFQRARSLPATGAVDRETASALGLISSGSPTGEWTDLRIGAQGQTVVSMQRAIINDGIYLVGGADGDFGRYSEAGLKKYQANNGLAQTGVLDQPTAIKMGLYTPPTAAETTTTTVDPASTTTTVDPASTTTTVDPTTTTTTVDPASTTTTVDPASTTTTVDPSTTTSTVAPETADAPRSTVGGVVWLDANDDGLRDSDESVATNVEVRLINTDSGDRVTVISQSDGTYDFGGVDAGSYTLEVVFPPDLSLTLANVGADDDIDSDLVDTVQRTDPSEQVGVIQFSLTASTGELSIDIGLTETVTS